MYYKGIEDLEEQILSLAADVRLLEAQVSLLEEKVYPTDDMPSRTYSYPTKWAWPDGR